MHIRSCDGGAPLDAKLRLLPEQAGKRRFVLLTRDEKGRLLALGPLVASIGYEIMEDSPLERAALTLAGFRLRRAVPNRAATEK